MTIIGILTVALIGCLILSVSVAVAHALADALFKEETRICDLEIKRYRKILEDLKLSTDKSVEDREPK